MARHHDDPRSLRVLTAAAMLRRGRDLDTVARVTGVPVALLELHGELDQTPADRHRPARPV